MLDAGLPNVEGDISNSTYALFWTGNATRLSFNGAFKGQNETGTNASSTTVGSTGYKQLHFDASSYNPIYGASNTVQPPALSFIPQIKF